MHPCRTPSRRLPRALKVRLGRTTRWKAGPTHHHAGPACSTHSHLSHAGAARRRSVAQLRHRMPQPQRARDLYNPAHSLLLHRARTVWTHGPSSVISCSPTRRASSRIAPRPHRRLPLACRMPCLTKRGVSRTPREFQVGGQSTPGGVSASQIEYRWSRQQEVACNARHRSWRE